VPNTLPFLRLQPLERLFFNRGEAGFTTLLKIADVMALRHARHGRQDAAVVYHAV
jgi:hypothetical protein